jgi:alkanesulfonate monooxygenase SsuD/methylene tetrahydromethanopterin reductase-like flavin-dependent oxidoreductase (luciferase family)
MRLTNLARIGAYVWPWGTTPPTVDQLGEQARHAERLGFDSVHVPYHTTLPTSWVYASFGNRSIVDPLVVLPVLVERTSRIRVGLSAAPLPTRHPFLWAQYLASLDIHSGGRLIATCAPGWWEDDFRVGGATLEELGAHMDEALEIVTRLWAGAEIGTRGRFWDARGLALEPRPAQQPLPLWIGGAEPAIERAARFGSAWAPLFSGPAAVPGMRERLDEAASRYGRRVEIALVTCALVSEDEEYLEREARPKLVQLGTFNEPADAPEDWAVCGPAEACADQVRRLFASGVDYLVLDFQLFGLETVDFAREQMSRFADTVLEKA